MRPLLPILAAALFAGWASAADLPDLRFAEGRPVTRVVVRNETRVGDAEVRALFGLRAGDVYSVERVQRGLARLAQKVSLRDVVVRGAPDEGGIALELEVLAEPLIRTIRLRGNRRLGNKQLRDRLQTRVDRPLRAPQLAQDVEAIRELYEGEGFPEAAAAPRVEPRRDPRWLRLVFDIREGRPRSIVRVEGDAGDAMDTERMLSILGLREGAPASRTRLRDGVRRLLEVLHREGYPEARAGRAAFRLEGDAAVLVLPLTVGEPTDVRVEDVDAWAAAPLREIARERFGEPLDEDWISRTAALMEENLHFRGYYHATVTPETGHAYGRRRVVFQVERGPRSRLTRVSFDGNENLSSSGLRRYMSLVVGGVVRRPPFSQEALERDLRVLADVYASSGFLDAAVSVAELSVAQDGGASLHLRVEEGPRYLIGEVSFEGDGALEDLDARTAASLPPGLPADPGAVEQARLRVLRELERRGHPDAEVSVRTERFPEAGRVHVRFRVDGGPAVRFGQAVVYGNTRTQTKVVRRELTIREGDPWDPEEVLRSRQRLYRLGFFQRVRIEPLDRDPGASVRDVGVEVEEQDAGSVAFGLGYGTEEGIKGSGGLSHANLWGTGRSLGFRYDFDELDRSWAVNFREPWLWERPYDLRLSLLRSHQDRDAYDLSALAFQASLERSFGDYLKGSLLYTLEENRLSDVVDETVLGEDRISAYLLSAVGPVLVWDSRDDPFNPRRGFHHTLQAEWALEALGSEVEYERYVGSVSGFFSAGDLTLALLARGGIALRQGSTADLPVNKRFFLGGRSTVRGFQRDEVGPRAQDGTPVGGDVMVNVKAELRFPMWKRLGGALFWDTGNVWNQASGLPSDSGLRQGVGGGLRYVTPVGPVSLDVGFNLARREDEDPYVWYFTIGNVF
ncbi:MAG: outer membrane protein assembly factor BamA [Deferrisomatales bacterium]|nr:outer membrane protein assembly factor BamA [Deferrisomatales bacterium]